jgi:hypothetical protein
MATIFPKSPAPQVNVEYQGYRYNGTYWDIIGIDLTADYQPKVSGVSDTEIGYLDGVTSAIQTQINTVSGKAPPIGGTTGQVLSKIDGTDYNTQWVSQSGGSSVPFLKMLSGWYYKSPSQDTTTNQLTNKTHWQPFLVSETTTFDRIAIRTSSATWTATNTATIRLGIFNDNNGFPSTVALDAGTVNPSANNTTYEITINQTLSPGIYWLAFNIISPSNTGSYQGNTSTSFNNMPVAKILLGTIRPIVAFTYTQNVTDGFISAPEFSNNSVDGLLSTVTVFLRVA